MTNQKIAEILEHISVYLEMEDESFKPRAYEKAAEAIATLPEELAIIYKKGGRKAIQEIHGVGASIAEKIEEALTKGRVKYYEDLKRHMPVELDELLRVEGLGPKHIKRLYNELGVKDIASLERAARGNRVAHLAGFGVRSQEKILQAIAFAKSSGERMVLGFVLPLVRELCERLGDVPGASEVTIAGSVRRMKETIGDADLLAVARSPKKLIDFFVSMPDVMIVHARGDTKASVKLDGGLNVDLRVVPKESYGAALNYFTGSKDHNIALREIAIKKGRKLNEYGLFKGKKRIAGKTEREVYEALGLSYIEPEIREMGGEIEASRAGDLPTLIGYGDLRGDLQVQTNWTDGKNSIEEMARAAITSGLEYIAITDHTKRLAVFGGCDEKKLRRQMKEIDQLNERFKIPAYRAGRQDSGFKILKGTECDILKDGTLDLPDSVLKDLDIVGVSVHSQFNLPRAEQTKRIIRAMENPYVHVLFHPTGRVIGKREPCDVDMEIVIKTAQRTGTVLEIDSFPTRLDLRDEYVRQCVKAGVRMTIDSDAHTATQFAYLECGIGTARRGWARRSDIINAWPLGKMLQFLKH